MYEEGTKRGKRVGAFTSAIMAYGLSYLYGLYGTLQVAEIGEVLPKPLDDRGVRERLASAQPRVTASVLLARPVPAASSEGRRKAMFQLRTTA